MRCAILFGLCALALVSVSEARSFTRKESSLKNRFLSGLASKLRSFDRKEEVATGGTQNENDDESQTSATIGALMYGLKCMTDENMWKRMPEEALKVVFNGDVEEFEKFSGQDFHTCLATAAYASTYKENPAEQDRIFKLYSQFIQCQEMGALAKLADHEEEYVRHTTKIMTCQCHRRGGEMEASQAGLEDAEKGQQSDTTKRNLMKMLRNLLAKDKVHKREAEPECDTATVSNSVFEAMSFAGYCNLYSGHFEREGLGPACEYVKDGVKKYIEALIKEDQAELDELENIFRKDNIEYKCGEVKNAALTIMDLLKNEITSTESVVELLFKEGLLSKLIIGANEQEVSDIRETAFEICENNGVNMAMPESEETVETDENDEPVDRRLLKQRLYSFLKKM